MRKMLMLLVPVTVIAALALRPQCPAPPVPTTAAPRAESMKVPEAVAIVNYETQAMCAVGRNVFAYRSMEDRRSRLSPVAEVHAEGQARVPVLHREDDGPRQPDYRYLGAFGPAENPIIVVKRGADVVNVPLRKP